MSVLVVGYIVVVAIIMGRMPRTFKIPCKRSKQLLLWTLKMHHVVIFQIGSEAELTFLASFI